MADWKYDPLALLGGQRLLSNPDPDAEDSIKKYYGTGTKAWKKYGEFLNPTREPGVALHVKGGAVKRGSSTVPAMCSGGKVVRSWSK